MSKNGFNITHYVRAYTYVLLNNNCESYHSYAVNEVRAVFLVRFKAKAHVTSFEISLYINGKSHPREQNNLS